MDWIKRAPGITIFIGIWLLVALVPVWRLRAERQWQNPQLNFLALGLQQRTASELASRYPDDSAAQLTALIQPNLVSINMASPSDVQHIKESDEYFDRFAALANRFPNDLSIRSQWLLETTRGALSIEDDALLASYDLQPDARGQIPKRKPIPAWMSVHQREAAIECAQKGAVLESDNAFWPWMEAILNFSLQRTNAGFLCLEKAGQCARYEDGIVAGVQRRIALMKRVQTVDFGDEFAEQWNALFPHYAPMRAVARESMWQANLAMKRGDTARALQIAGIMQRAAAPVAHNRGYYITQLVGEALCYISWKQTWVYAGIKPEPYSFAKPEVKSGENQRNEILSKFTAFARQHGRADLAASAIKLQSTFGSRKFPNPNFEASAQSARPLLRLHWLSAQCLQFALWGALVWIAMFAVTKGQARPPLETRRSMAKWAAFCCGVTGALWWFAIQEGIVKDAFPAFNAPTLPDNFSLESSLPFYGVLLWLTPVILTTALATFSGIRFPVRQESASWVRLTSVLLTGGTFISFILLVLTVGSTSNSTVLGQLWPGQLLAFWTLFPVSVAFIMWRVGPALRLCVALFSSALFLLVFAFLANLNSRDPSMIDALMPLLVGAGFFTWIGIFGLARTGKLRRFAAFPLIFEFTQRTRLMSATIAVVSTLVYFSLIWAAAGPRHEAQSILEQQWSAKTGATP